MGKDQSRHSDREPDPVRLRLLRFQDNPVKPIQYNRQKYERKRFAHCKPDKNIRQQDRRKGVQIRCQHSRLPSPHCFHTQVHGKPCPHHNRCQKQSERDRNRTPGCHKKRRRIQKQIPVKERRYISVTPAVCRVNPVNSGMYLHLLCNRCDTLCMIFNILPVAHPDHNRRQRQDHCRKDI